MSAGGKGVLVAGVGGSDGRRVDGAHKHGSHTSGNLDQVVEAALLDAVRAGQILPRPRPLFAEGVAGRGRVFGSYLVAFQS